MNVIHTISLFSGTGMLDRGVEAALKKFGVEARPLAYCEIDKFAQRILRSRIKDGLLRDAPIFADVRQFPAERLRGVAEAVVAGFPCQPFSVAGKRAGAKDERYLFGEVIRIAVDAGVRLLFLENVPGLRLPKDEDLDDGTKLTLPAPIAAVCELLAASGFHAQWTAVGAGAIEGAPDVPSVGAAHGRERWWCIAWRFDCGGQASQELAYS